MWSPMVVVRHPLAQDQPKMSFIQDDQPVQTLSPDGADQTLAECIRLWASYGRLEHRQAHRRHRVIDGGRINAVAVVDQESVRLITGHDGAELLDRPRGRGVLVTFQCTI